MLGDPSKAIKKLGWKPKVSLEELCKEMMDEDLKFSKRDKLLLESGFKIISLNNK